MKKIAVVVLVVAFLASAMPLLAEGGKKDNVKSAFQDTANAIGEGCKAGGQTVSDVYKEVVSIPEKAGMNPGAFQRMSDGIKEGSVKAKQTSLRTPKSNVSSK